MYIAPSSGEPLPNLDLHFKWILRKVEVVFWCLEWECCLRPPPPHPWAIISGSPTESNGVFTKSKRNNCSSRFTEHWISNYVKLPSYLHPKPWINFFFFFGGGGGDILCGVSLSVCYPNFPSFANLFHKTMLILYFSFLHLCVTFSQLIWHFKMTME